MQLSGLDIIVAYEKRWSIEPLFNQLKNDWGMKQTWQKTRKVLHRWVHIIAGRIRMGLIRYFSQVRVRDWWDGKSPKFHPPDTDILRRFEDLL